jgi:8-oxo-dGTP pyrophosphatase MutT (NUDIX family)
MGALRLEDIARRLGRREATDPHTGAPSAAVAVVLREQAEGLEALMIRRAESPNDPWSGHMAFPGGRREPTDASLLDTAVRETSEELGVDLRGSAEVLGALAPFDAMARGKRAGLTVHPYVFALRAARVELSPNYEVAEALWVALGPMVRGETRTKFLYPYGDGTVELPGFDVGGRVVWGLTYAMLERLFSLAQE